MENISLPKLGIIVIIIVSILLTLNFSENKNDDTQLLPLLIFRSGYCGDGTCDKAESCDTCPLDCRHCTETPLTAKGVYVFLIILAFLLLLKYRWGQENIPCI